MGDERTVSATDRRLGQRVRVRRLEIGMSQERLADLLGVTFQQVQKYEKGVNRIAASRLYDISTALNLPVADFFEGLDRQPRETRDKTSRLSQALATPDAVELVLAFGAIRAAKVRRRILELARALREDDDKP